MIQPFSSSAKEARLLRRGDVKQLVHEVSERHMRADDPVALAGSVVMAPLVAIAKAGNAIAGEFSPNAPEPLEEGGLAYTMRDIRSVADNALGAVGNLLTGHPVRAAGNIIKAGFDAVDVVTVDPLLDIGSGLAGHTTPKTRGQVGELFSMGA